MEAEPPTAQNDFDETETILRPVRSGPLLKVDMCKFFPQGKCLKGESCTFAHRKEEVQARPNLYRTSPCFKFWTTGKCIDDCKYAHSLESIRSKGKSGCRDEDEFTPGGIWSRQTTADLESVGGWSRQSSLAVTSQEFDDGLTVGGWSRQTSLAVMSQEFDDGLINYAKELDDDVIEQIAEETFSEKQDLEDELSQEMVSTEYHSVSSSTQDTECPLTNDMIDYECARLQDISKLHELKIHLKNTFLAFEERSSVCGSAVCRARSA